MIKRCVMCGKDMEVKPYLIKSGRKKFCSRLCSGKHRSLKYVGMNGFNWKGGPVCHTCLICGAKILVKPSHAKIGEGKYCSLKCRNISYKENRRGIKNFRWRGGKVERLCILCGKIFKTARCNVKVGHGKFCSKSCNSIWNASHSKKESTSIEIKMGQGLTRVGVTFKTQHPIWAAKTVPDFFIEPNICIYCDGDYWHRREGVPERDAQQDFMLQFLGYKVYRFWEKEINKSVGKCIDEVKEIDNGTQKKL